MRLVFARASLVENCLTLGWHHPPTFALHEAAGEMALGFRDSPARVPDQTERLVGLGVIGKKGVHALVRLA